MSFHSQPFSARFGVMGDTAEKVFEDVYPEGWVRWGLQRPPINVGSLPPRVRYAPDYLTKRGFAEVQGFGRDQIVKVKVDKFDNLKWWNDEVHRTDLFLYDQHKSTYGWVSLELLSDLVKWERIEIRQFHDGPEYFAFPAVELTAHGVDWERYQPPAERSESISGDVAREVRGGETDSQQVDELRPDVAHS